MHNPLGLVAEKLIDILELSQLLGNFGEFLGAIAVVVTLVYLAKQVKQNRESLDANSQLQKLSMRQQITQGSATQTRTRASAETLNSALAKLHISHERLSDQELMSFSSFMSSAFRMWEGAHYQYRNGLMDESEWEAESAGYASNLELELTRSVWGRIRTHYSEEFRAMVDEIVAQKSSDE